MSFKSDLGNNLVFGASIVPGALRTSTVTGTAIDMADGECCALVYNGAVTDGTHTPTIEESVDSAFTTPVLITPIDTPTAVTSATTSGTVQAIKFLRTRRYVRVKVVVTGSPGTGGYYDAMILQPKKVVY